MAKNDLIRAGCTVSFLSQGLVGLGLLLKVFQLHDKVLPITEIPCHKFMIALPLFAALKVLLLHRLHKILCHGLERNGWQKEDATLLVVALKYILRGHDLLILHLVGSGVLDHRVFFAFAFDLTHHI
jgi:hypothetical protein